MIHDQTRTTRIHAHYFHVSGCAMRRILANPPVRHLHIASFAMFANLLAAVVRGTYLDYTGAEVQPPLCQILSGFPHD